MATAKTRLTSTGGRHLIGTLFTQLKILGVSFNLVLQRIRFGLKLASQLLLIKLYRHSPMRQKSLIYGVINNLLRLSYLQLCFDLIKDWITKNPYASICTAEGVEVFKDIAIFQDYHGLPEFRQVYIYIYILQHACSI